MKEKLGLIAIALLLIIVSFFDTGYKHGSVRKVDCGQGYCDVEVFISGDNWFGGEWVLCYPDVPNNIQAKDVGCHE